MASKTSLEKEIAQAEDRLLPKDGGDNLQRRLEDYARRFGVGEDDTLRQYDAIFTDDPQERPQETAVKGVSEHQTVTKTTRGC